MLTAVVWFWGMQKSSSWLVQLVSIMAYSAKYLFPPETTCTNKYLVRASYDLKKPKDLFMSDSLYITWDDIRPISKSANFVFKVWFLLKTSKEASMSWTPSVSFKKISWGQPRHMSSADSRHNRKQKADWCLFLTVNRWKQVCFYNAFLFSYLFQFCTWMSQQTDLGLCLRGQNHNLPQLPGSRWQW